MMSAIPKTSSSDAFDDLVKQEYSQWEKTHAKMKESPPPDGHDYLKHANNLLVLLQGVSELHPFAKAVIASFQTAVMFEQDRRENDARVTAVFLAQTDVMRVLLDVDDLVSRRRSRPEDALRSSAALGKTLLQIQGEIKSCGNSIDTYYKESRIVKFWKAQDWKKRMLEHIEHFNRFRLQLQQTLSLQVASGVEDLVSKMDVVLSRFFIPKYDWERNLDMKTRGFADTSWMNDTTTLQSLISETKNPSLSTISENSNQVTAMKFAAEAQLSKVKTELQLSIESLCEINMNMFELKLNFHAQQMEQAIVSSAHLVIQSLSGPSDRLINEDLRQLWKEMDWIFCVENKLFISAVFEFYLDRFSTNRIVLASSLPQSQETGITERSDTNGNRLNSVFSLSVPAPKFSYLSRLGSFNHPDAWTLEYIAQYGDLITQAIDNDSSGFIRISEANAITRQIPSSWNFAQWCAYATAGWAYGGRIYRGRISKLLSLISDLHASILPSNRCYFWLFSIINYAIVWHAFTQEPVGQNIPTVSPELRELVKQNVMRQDTLYRGYLQSLKWNVEDESTLHLLYGESSPEEYILQFCTLMLEHFLDIAYMCRTVTIDIREWIHTSLVFGVMREVAVKRISKLASRFEDEKEASQCIATYHGGIWSSVSHEFNMETLYHKYLDKPDPTVSYSLRKQLRVDRLPDTSIIDGFPLKPTASAYLQYTPWEDYVKTLDESDVPLLIPKTWGAADGTMVESTIERTHERWDKFPLPLGFCDICLDRPGQEGYYRCTDVDCIDLILCNRCYNLPEARHNLLQHTYDHPMMRIISVKSCVLEVEMRVALESENILEQLRQEYHTWQRSNVVAESVGPLNTEKPSSGGGTSPQSKEELKAPEEHKSAAEKTEEESEGIPAKSDGTITETELKAKEQRPLEPKSEAQADSLTKSAQVVVEKVSLGFKEFICGRCSQPISMELQFFRCVGHSCQDYYICSQCATAEPYEADESDHQWWHTLFCLRKSLIIGAPASQPPTEAAVHASSAEDSAPVDDVVEKRKSPILSEDSVHARISKMEEKLDTFTTKLETVIHTNNATSEASLSSLQDKIERSIQSSNLALEAKVQGLETKLDGLITALQQLLGDKATL